VTFLSALLPIALSATLDVAAGTSLADALGRARAGDVIRLGPGVHAGSLGRISDLRIEGAGAGISRIVAPEGTDGAIATGRVALVGLTLEAGNARTALKVLGGEAILLGVELRGQAVGLFVESGRVTGRDVQLAGVLGLLQAGGEVTLRDGHVLGAGPAHAGLAVLRGRLDVTRSSITGPFEEAALTVASGSAALDDVVIRDPGPTGIAVVRGEVTGRDVEISGAREVPIEGQPGVEAILGDCVQLRRGAVSLASSALVRCGGTAVSASGGTLRLDGVDAQGGSAGVLVLLDGARADLRGNWITGRGPGLVLADSSQADATFNRWRTDPVFWVECGAGARIRLGFGEHSSQPCSQSK
jgi:hypothetical protein